MNVRKTSSPGGTPMCEWKKEWASSHTPRSNIAWESCIQRMAIPSISDGQSDRWVAHIKLAKVQKECKYIKSAFPVKMDIYTLVHYYKVSRTSIERIQWNCADKLFWGFVYFLILVEFLNLKRDITPRKKIQSEFPVDMHIYTLSPSLLQSFRKLCWAVSEELRWQEKLTEGLGSKTLNPSQFVAWGKDMV